MRFKLIAANGSQERRLVLNILFFFFFFFFFVKAEPKMPADVAHVARKGEKLRIMWNGYVKNVSFVSFMLRLFLKVCLFRYGSWIGGSILASLGSFQQMWISKQVHWDLFCKEEPLSFFFNLNRVELIHPLVNAKTNFVADLCALNIVQLCSFRLFKNCFPTFVWHEKKITVLL